MREDGRIKAFLKRKNIVISAKRYGIDALGAMAQGLFCSLLIGTILNTIGNQFHVSFLTAQLITINGVGYTIGGMASFMSGAAMAVAIGYALQAPPLVLFSLATVGYACNALGQAGGPLAVLFVAIIAAEAGKMVSKETKIDILVTPIVTTLVGIGAAWVIAPGRGADPAHLLRCYLLGTGADRACRRRGCGRLLRADGRLRGHELPGKRLGRPCEPGAGHLHAADAEYCEKSPHLDCPHAGLSGHGSCGHLYLPSADERRRYQFRHGNLRAVRTAGRVDRLGYTERGRPC